MKEVKPSLQYYEWRTYDEIARPVFENLASALGGDDELYGKQIWNASFGRIIAQSTFAGYISEMGTTTISVLPMAG